MFVYHNAVIDNFTGMTRLNDYIKLCVEYMKDPSDYMTYADLQDKAKNSDIVEEKRAASIIEDGSGSAPGTVSRDFNKAVTSLRDAFDLAKQELAQ